MRARSWTPAALAVATLAGAIARADVTVTAPVAARIVIPAGPFRAGAILESVREGERRCQVELRAAGALAAEAGPRCRARAELEPPSSSIVLPAYAIDRTEVTRADYAACVRAGACAPIPGLGDPPLDARHPVERPTFADAVAYCRHRGGRLPTEAEWEKAARGPAGGPFPWGAPFGAGHANHGRAARPGLVEADGLEGEEDASDGAAGSSEVGVFPSGASPFGLADVAGNVWEWTAGLLSRDPYGGEPSRFDPHGALAGDERVVRGGSYRSPPSDLRVTRRAGLAASERRDGVGFRCAYDLAAGAAGAAAGRPRSVAPRR